MTWPIACYCEDFVLSRNGYAADNGMCMCGHFEDDHTHEGDRMVCAATH